MYLEAVSYTHLSSSMQIPVLKKIVINQGLGMAVADKKIIEVAINEMTTITEMCIRDWHRLYWSLWTSRNR